ncbi:MAG TPA: hypothetical protein VHI93_00970 [Candidatus Thermoplasmatota archaeon]|nr:hypothetical protein [Candidatus Thermoplasmatota archaeon]
MSTDPAATGPHGAAEDGHGLFGEACAACGPDATPGDSAEAPRTGPDPLLSGPQASRKA